MGLIPDKGRVTVSRRERIRGLQYGGFSFAITVCFVIAVVLLNIVVSIVCERYSLRIDLTGNQIFRLSRESERLLADLDQDVTIYILTREDYFSSGNLYYVQANEVLRQYAARCDHIHLEYIDLARTPGFERRFPQFQLSSYTIILESGERSSTILVNDLFNTEFEPYSYTEYITSSKAEQVLSSAIMGVTTERQVAVSILEGFGESGTETLENTLIINNYNPIRQNILGEEINPDADLAIICAPIRDYTEDALRKLDRFLQNNNEYGKSLFYFPSILQPLTPNLDAFLADWGIKVGEGIVYQTDNSKLVTMSNYWSIAEYTERDFAKSAIDKRLFTIVPEARPLSTLFETRDNVAVSIPLIFDNSVVVAPLENDEAWTPEVADQRGPIPAFIISAMTSYSRSQSKEVKSNLLVFGSYEFIGSTVLSSRTVGNLDYILNVFSIVTNHQDAVYITPKTIGAQELPLSSSAIMILGAIFVAGLPLCVLILGGFVFFRRRHL